jgi:hypothetical protein
MSGPILGVPGPPATGYFQFVRDYMGVPAGALPDDSWWIPASYNLSLDVVNIILSIVPQVGSLDYPSQYALAVYNFAADRLVTLTPDVDPPFFYPGVKPPTPYFQYLREKFKVDSFVPGVVTFSSDVTTSVSFSVPDWFKNMTMGDLQTLKTPWGRTYMAIAQQYGPTIVDLT